MRMKPNESKKYKTPFERFQSAYVRRTRISVLGASCQLWVCTEHKSVDEQDTMNAVMTIRACLAAE
jgi:hypothetical protein